MTENVYSIKRKMHEATLPKVRLEHLDIELTERCNNACVHCFINQAEDDPKALAAEMDTPHVQDILQQAADLGCLTVRFTGGEPLLREDFSELYLYARRLGLRVTLFTNARLINREIVKLFQGIPPGQPVQVTVYGMRPGSYDAAAASPGAFNEFWRGVELLREHRIPFIVKQSLLPANRAEQAEFESFAASLPHMDQFPVYTMNFELRGRRDNPAKNRFIRNLRFSPEETVAERRRDPSYRRTMRQYVGKFTGAPGDRLFPCGAGLGVCVDSYGAAQMCMGLRHPDTVYDLLQAPGCPPGVSPLRHTLDTVFPQMRQLRAANPDYLQRCARCFLKGLCEQCPARSWQEHGTLDTPVEYLCAVAHAQARDFGLLDRSEQAWEVDPETATTRVARFRAAQEVE